MGKERVEISKEWLVEHYVNKNESIPTISNALNCSTSTVFRRLREHNIECTGIGRVKGYKCSEETLKKMSKSHMGHIVTDETRRKIIEGNLGRKHTPEELINLREGVREYWRKKQLKEVNKND